VLSLSVDKQTSNVTALRNDDRLVEFVLVSFVFCGAVPTILWLAKVLMIPYKKRVGVLESVYFSRNF
jgi:hypothetical protein